MGWASREIQADLNGLVPSNEKLFLSTCADSGGRFFLFLFLWFFSYFLGDIISVSVYGSWQMTISEKLKPQLRRWKVSFSSVKVTQKKKKTMWSMYCNSKVYFSVAFTLIKLTNWSENPALILILNVVWLLLEWPAVGHARAPPTFDIVRDISARACSQFSRTKRSKQ